MELRYETTSKYHHKCPQLISAKLTLIKKETPLKCLSVLCYGRDYPVHNRSSDLTEEQIVIFFLFIQISIYGCDKNSLIVSYSKYFFKTISEKNETPL